jgi:hypothetical protein
MAKKTKSNKKRGGATGLLNPFKPPSTFPKSPLPIQTQTLLKSFIPPLTFPKSPIPTPNLLTSIPTTIPKPIILPQAAIPKKDENILVWFIKLVFKIIITIIGIIITILFIVCLIGFILALVGGYIFIDSIFKGITYAIKYTINPLLKVFKIKKIKTPKSFYELMKMFIYMTIKNL